MAMQKGTQISVCPNIIVYIDSGMPARTSIVKRDTPTIISGRNIGTMIKPIIGALPGKVCLTDAEEASMASVVANIELAVAIIMLFVTADCSPASCHKTPNHLNVKPDNGNAIMVLSLNANSGNKRVGEYKNKINTSM